MKKILTITALCGIFAVPAGAVQKCVALDANVDGTSVDYDEYGADWSVTFPNVTVKGIGVCGSNYASPTASLSENVTYNYELSLNYNCWCRIISPVVSSWWITFDDGDPNACVEGCSYYCAYSLKDEPQYRAGIFGSLSN